jgi:hypothetical protein
MGNSRNLEHAKHNEEVYRYLYNKPEFCDWIITTAFYSAIHYVRHKMVPCELTLKDGKTHKFEDFESLFASHRRSEEGRHGFQLRWIRDNHGEISISYRRLHELSNEARYLNYQFETTGLIPDINSQLKKIRLYCVK